MYRGGGVGGKKKRYIGSDQMEKHYKKRVAELLANK